MGALVEPLAVAYHAVRLSGAQPDHTALVFGAGPIGLVTTAALRAAGVEQVIVVEPADVRKAKAPGAGADHVLDPTASVDVTAAVIELTRGRGADVSFECAGIDPVLATAIRSTRAGGTCVNVAIWGHEASVAMNDLVFREVNLLGSLAYAERPPRHDRDDRRAARSTRSSSSPAGSSSTTSSTDGLRRADQQQGGERQDPGPPGS